jgi:CRISPR-associated endonuclease/helicase Cas3
MVGHAHLMATALLRHLLVVDEVHASDAYMQRLLEDVLERHLAAGGHALLLSATLGGEARERLLRAGGRTGSLPFEAAIAAPYPLITHRSRGAAESRPVAADGHNRAIRLSTRPWMADAEPVARHALEAASEGAKVIVIRNTVGDCIATQEQIERLAGLAARPEALFSCCGRPAPHHARFARGDRQAIDRALEERFGKNRSEGGCVVVATQTVQQSLDLDADLLVTDLGPADVLLQRLGRLHRHPRGRPASFREPTAVVLTPAARDLASLIGDRGTAANFHGLGSVYPDLRIIEGTWRLLEQNPEWRIPEMNRRLVESSLHSAVLERIVQAGGPRWRAHATQMIGATLGQARLAQLNLVEWSRPYSESSFPDSADQRIQTRLGEGDRLVHFRPPAPGPFGNAVTELVLPAWWVKGLDADLSDAEHAISDGGVLRFEFGPHSFIYDRLGLRRAPKA